jgi:anti-sigma B factor antagonist
LLDHQKEPAMEITIRKFEENHVIDVAGEVDMYNASRLKEVVNTLMERRIGIFILNLKKVTYIDSSGIGALLSINATLVQAGLAFRIVNIARSVMRVIELTKLVGFLPIEATELEAIESIARDRSLLRRPRANEREINPFLTRR